MINKNLIILSLAYIFSSVAGPITVFLSGIIGATMISLQSLATLPAALMVLGTALGSIIASYTMSQVGRKTGFMISTILVSLAALIASYSVFHGIFILYCFTNLLIGIGQAFTHQYRFAAAENVKQEYIPSAISIILFAGMIGALIGPNVATLTKDLISSGVYTGSYIFLSILTIIPFFFFLFYSDFNFKTKKTKEIKEIKRSRSYIQILSQPKFFQAVVAAGFAYCVMSILMTATPISMHINHNISIGKTGFVIMFHILAMFMPSIFTGILIKKFGHNKIMYSGLLILFFSILINLASHHFYNYLLGLIFLGIGWNFLFISGSSLLTISYSPAEKFKAQGLNDFIVFTTQAFGALSAGFLLTVLGWKLVNIFCIPLLFFVTLTIFFSQKKYESIYKNSNK